MNFTLQADGASDGCRFQPAIRVTSYSASNTPKYLRLYNATDTVMMIEGYGYNAYVNTAANELLLQLDTVLCADTKIYLSADVDLAITLSSFSAAAADGHDTLRWRTESEKDNRGFHIYRRIPPLFMDSLTAAVDSAVPDSLLGNAGRLLRQKRIRAADTAWVRITTAIIPSAVSGNSPDPHEYMKIDWDVENDVEYEYMLEAVSNTRDVDSYGPITVRPMVVVPKRFFLFSNFPNPARRFTNIRFDIAEKTKVSLLVYNLQGRLVRKLAMNKVFTPGFYRIQWSCDDDFGRLLAAGPYIYRLQTAKYAKARVMILLR